MSMQTCGKCSASWLYAGFDVRHLHSRDSYPGAGMSHGEVFIVRKDPAMSVKSRNILDCLLGPDWSRELIYRQVIQERSNCHAYVD